MKSPIQNEVGAIFVPVKDIEKARDWYCDLLDVPAEEEFPGGHLYVLPMKHAGVVLDSKIYSEEAVFGAPAFHFNTEDIEAAYTYMKEKGIDVVSEIQFGHFFNFKDPDGNLLMICQC
ncbi:VOC family protein [Halobacillus litoralis]|uniref:VOC family protein n=1 Tax=Halobacillus litoralis TaxID=45668 RepID=A0A845E096_9BACI|nr:VOC family protein [Halobacillus litoralis]MYL48133.1 VOC family protein [Halobacillus litoralis]